MENKFLFSNMRRKLTVEITTNVVLTIEISSKSMFSKNLSKCEAKWSVSKYKDETGHDCDIFKWFQLIKISKGLSKLS